MARDIFVLGDEGSGSEILLPGVIEFSEQPLVRLATDNFPTNRYGGYAIPQKFGSSRLILSYLYNVEDMAEDALDIGFALFKTQIARKLRSGSAKLWTADDWFHNVVLDSDAFVEQERSAYSVSFSLNFLCSEGRRFYKDEVSEVVATAGTFEIVSYAETPLYIEFNTAVGNTYVIENSLSSGEIRVNANTTGLIRVHVEENRATRAGEYVDDEITGVFPEFPVNEPMVITMTGLASATFKYRNALVA